MIVNTENIQATAIDNYNLQYLDIENKNRNSRTVLSC